jgi:hypothetical protein
MSEEKGRIGLLTRNSSIPSTRWKLWMPIPQNYAERNFQERFLALLGLGLASPFGAPPTPVGIAL